jgi:23S rRNA pseudouridine1911/1915/1917 synthase
VELTKNYIKEKYNKPGDVFLGVTHRLDRPVSGVVLFARTSKALDRINKLFRERKIHKKYWAVVKKKPPKEKDKLTHWLIKDEKKNIVTAYDHFQEGSKKAELYYSVMGKLNDHYLLEINPITGRSHQIRVQLASIGCPIRGDLKYGFHKANPDAGINLHARELHFIHPVKKDKQTIIASLPENDFWEQFLSIEKVKIKDKDIGKLV